jgi:hypothetical protein
VGAVPKPPVKRKLPNHVKTRLKLNDNKL